MKRTRKNSSTKPLSLARTGDRALTSASLRAVTGGDDSQLLQQVIIRLEKVERG